MFRVKRVQLAFTEYVRQINIYIYEKSQFDSLVWGSLTLAPIKCQSSTICLLVAVTIFALYLIGVPCNYTVIVTTLNSSDLCESEECSVTK